MKLEGKTNAQLVAMIDAIERDPANREPPGGLYIYTKKARDRKEKITRQITHNMEVSRAAAGRPVVCDGYSGRQNNKR